MDTHEQQSPLVLEAYEILLRIRLLRLKQKTQVRDDVLTERQFLALACIAEFPNLAEKDLGDWMGLRTTSLHQLITSLLRAGYIAKQQNPDDRREQLLSLTDAGSDLLDEQKRRSAERYEFLFESVTQRREVDRVRRFLREMKASLAATMQRQSLTAREDVPEAVMQSFWTGVGNSAIPREISSIE